MNVTVLTAENFKNEVETCSIPVLIDFWAAWCGPCKMLSPIVEEIAQENDNFKVCKVNIDEQPQLAAQFGIMSIPTLIVFKNGTETKRSIGVISKGEILDLMN